MTKILPRFFECENKVSRSDSPSAAVDDEREIRSRQAQLALAAALGSLQAGDDTALIEAAQANVAHELAAIARRRERDRLAALHATELEVAQVCSSSRLRGVAARVRRTGRRSPQRRSRRACGPLRGSSGDGGDPPPRSRSVSSGGGHHVHR